MSKSRRQSGNEREPFEQLQEKLAFLEELVQQLNDAVSKQQQELIELKSANALLHERYRQISAQQANAEAILDEKPPHY
ncbi:MAG: SlyX family protein [Proteobacteria bacterium]|jgi:uncharacterized coiled-coil protein SlyX|nr:SlyX family protein [Pseudomonadota bacterium]